MDVEDDVFVVFGAADAREGRVGGAGAVVFEAREARAQVAGVGEGEGFWDFDDETAFDEFQAAWVELRVGELVRGAGHAAEDLDARTHRVLDQAQDGQADADADAALEVPDDGDPEDEAHEEQLGPAADAQEELDVVGASSTSE